MAKCPCRKLDAIESDGKLSQDADAEKRAAKGQPKELDDAQAAFHFIAFLPIGDVVVKLDGLERQPSEIGTSYVPLRNNNLF